MAGWPRAGFRIASGKELQHEKEIRELADAIHLPQKLAIIKCKGHSNLATLEAKGSRPSCKIGCRIPSPDMYDKRL